MKKEETLRINKSDPDYEEYSQLVRDLHIATNPHLWFRTKETLDMPDAEVKATPEKVKEAMRPYHSPVNKLFDFLRR